MTSVSNVPGFSATLFQTDSTFCVQGHVERVSDITNSSSFYSVLSKYFTGKVQACLNFGTFYIILNRTSCDC